MANQPMDSCMLVTNVGALISLLVAAYMITNIDSQPASPLQTAPIASLAELSSSSSSSQPTPPPPLPTLTSPSDQNLAHLALLQEKIDKPPAAITINNNNLNLAEATTNTETKPATNNKKKKPNKKEQVRTWTHSDSYEWATTSDGTREETVDSNGRRQIKTKLTNALQAPGALHQAAPLADQGPPPPQPISSISGQGHQPGAFQPSNRQATSLVAPSSYSPSSFTPDKSNNTSQQRQTLPLANHHDKTATEAHGHQNEQQLSPVVGERQVPDEKPTPVFVSSTLRQLGNRPNDRFPINNINQLVNNKKVINTYDFPDSNMRVHIEEDADTDQHEPPGLKAELDEAILDTMGSQLQNGARGTQFQEQPPPKTQPQSNFALPIQPVGPVLLNPQQPTLQPILTSPSPTTVNQQQQQLQQEQQHDQLKSNLDLIIRQVTQDEARLIPSADSGGGAGSASLHPLTNQASDDQQLLQGQYGAAPSQYYLQAVSPQNQYQKQQGKHQQQVQQTTASPWTIQHRVYLISYPPTLAKNNNSSSEGNNYSSSANNQTAIATSQQHNRRQQQPQTIVQVYEQTQHFTGNPPPIASTSDRNNSPLAPLARSTATTGGGGGQSKYADDIYNHIDLSRIDDLFKLLD